MNTDPGPVYSYIAHGHMNVEIGAEAALFLEKEYISGIFVAMYDRDRNFFNVNVAPKARYKEQIKIWIYLKRHWHCTVDDEQRKMGKIVKSKGSIVC
jgi:hypothetical protein